MEPLLPSQKPQRGGRWADHRTVINGVFWRTRCGLPWRDVPPNYGPWKTVYNRFWRWTRNGTLSALVGRVRVIAEAIDELDRDLAREVSVDSSIVRAHQHAAGARKTASKTVDTAGTAVGTSPSPGGGRVLRRAGRTS